MGRGEAGTRICMVGGQLGLRVRYSKFIVSISELEREGDSDENYTSLMVPAG